MSYGKQTETWVKLSEHRWPNHWVGKCNRPVVPLRLSLYGRPMAGVHWERCSREKFLLAGFKRAPGWECLFIRWKHQVILSVYVGDFKMAGRQESTPSAWEAIRKAGVKSDQPTRFEHYLGCGQRPVQVAVHQAEENLQNVANLLLPSSTFSEEFDLQRNYYIKNVVLFEEDSILLLPECSEASGVESAWGEVSQESQKNRKNIGKHQKVDAFT